MSDIRVAVSACLLGEPVRYNGQDKLDAALAYRLGTRFQLIPICPEVELGLGVPRPAMQLEQSERGVRLVVSESGQDLTDTMTTFASARIAELTAAGVHGFVLKRRSPSCGLADAPLYSAARVLLDTTHGLFTAAVLAHDPHWPVAQEGDLDDPLTCERFIACVLAHAAGAT